MTRFMLIFLAVLGGLLQAPLALGLADPEGEALLTAGNEAYLAGRYAESAEAYEQLVKAGYDSGVVYYNLGNAYFRQDQLGRAILNYERARYLMPRDGDLNFNLRHAQLLTEDAVPETGSLKGAAFLWLDVFKLEELFWAFAVLNALLWGVLVLRLYSRADWNYYPLIVILLLWIVGGLSFGLKGYQVAQDDRAVILDQEADILAGPNPGETVLFKLHAGTIVEEVRGREGWRLISFPGEKRGWVKAEAIDRVRG